MTLNEAISVYWPVLTSVITGVIFLVGVYINLNNKMNNLKAEGAERDKEISELKGVVKTMQPDLGTIKTDIAVIKNTLEYIKGSVQSKTPVITSNNN